MKQTTKRFLSLIVSLLLIAAAFVAFLNFIQPAYGEVQKLKSEVTTREEFVASQQEAVRKVQGLISAYNTQGELRGVINLTLPFEQDVAGALTQLAGLIQDSTLGGKSFTISTPDENGGAPIRDSKGNESKDLVSLHDLGRVVFVTRFSGSYDNIKNFFEKLELNVRVFDIIALSIAPVASEKQTKQDIYEVDLQVMTYYQKDK
ncbi:MAG: hypothetical protein NUV53_01030 [Patescibacteria group bacterium]|nr:hypothetical protein [Patescibacteria group bacterium]